MSNELLLILSALVDIAVVFVSARLGSRWLFGTIAVNLILISAFGAKLIEVFGLVTNAGNIFYACVFLATHFLLENKSKKEAMETIWFGSVLVGLFILMSQSVIRFLGITPDDAVNTAIQSLFQLSPRIALGSILAYIFAQYVNIFTFTWLTLRLGEKFLWFRVNGANIGAQLVDSALFFTIAFIDLPGPILLQAILAGWAIKAFVVFLGTPFLYLNKIMSRNNKRRMARS